MEFVKETVIKATQEEVFAFHELPDAFEMLVPPWENAKIIQKADISKIGSRAIIETKILGFIPQRWVAEHSNYDPPNMFEDIQISGPFRRWKHRHIVRSHPKGAILRDEIDYVPPMSFLGMAMTPFLVTPKLDKMFDYRHKVTKEYCEKGEVK